MAAAEQRFHLTSLRIMASYSRTIIQSQAELSGIVLIQVPQWSNLMNKDKWAIEGKFTE